MSWRFLWWCLAIAWTTDAALVVSPQFLVAKSDEVPVIINGQLTTQHVVEIHCSHLVSQGTLVIGNISFNVNCVPPKYVYSYELAAQVPKRVRMHINSVYDVLSPTQFNVSKTAAIERILQTPYGFANRRLMILELGIAAYALAVAIEARDAVSSLNNKYNEFIADTFEPFRNNMTRFVDVTNNRLEVHEATFSVLGNITNDLRQSVTELEGNMTRVTRESAETTEKLEMLGNATSNNFRRVAVDIQNTRDAVDASLISSGIAVRNEFARTYTTMELFRNHTLNELKAAREQAQRALNKLERFTQVMWSVITKQEVYSLMTKVFYEALNGLEPGVEALVGEERLPPRDPSEFKNADRRILMEQVVVNLVRRGNIGGPDFAEIVSYRISFYTDTEFAIRSLSPAVNIETLIINQGPAICKRSFAGVDLSNNPLPELAIRNATNDTCRMWIEVTTIKCPAKSSSFNWSRADNGKHADAQSGVLNPFNCTADTIEGLTDRELVFSGMPAFQAWFGANVCGATLWTDGGQIREFQMIWAMLDKIGYIAQPTDSQICTTDLPTMGSDGNSPFFLMLQGIQLGIGAFSALLTEKKYISNGAIPEGVHCVENPLPFAPILRDANGVLINSGTVNTGKATDCFWLDATDEVVPVYAIAPLVSQPTIKQVTFSAFQKGADFVTDYLVDVSSISTSGIVLTTDLVANLPKPSLWHGNFDEETELFYDVPDRISTVDNSAVSRKNTAGCLAMRKEKTSTQTYEEFKAINTGGGVWDPASCAESVSNFAFQRGTASDGYQYCLTAGGVPVNESVSAYFPLQTELGPDAFVAQSSLCQVLKAFRVDKVPRQGRFVLTMEPRQWDEVITVVMPSGRLFVQQDSFCPGFVLSATGGSGFELLFTNERPTATTIVLTLRTNVSSEALLCNKDLTVTVPGIPAGTKLVQIPQCVGLNITVQRIAVRPEDAVSVLVSCPGSPITASSFAAASQSFTGVSAAVIRTITVTENAITASYNNMGVENAKAYLLTLQAQATSLALQGFNPGDGVLASLRQRLIDLENTTIIPPTFYANPVNTNFSSLENVLLGIQQLANRTRETMLLWAAGEGSRLQRLTNFEVNYAAFLNLSAQAAALAEEARNISAALHGIPPATLSELSLSSFNILSWASSPLATVERLTLAGVNGAANFFSGVAGFLSSTVGIIGTIIQTVITVCIIVGVMAGAYFIVIRPLKTRITNLEMRLSMMGGGGGGGGWAERGTTVASSKAETTPLVRRVVGTTTPATSLIV